MRPTRWNPAFVLVLCALCAPLGLPRAAEARVAFADVRLAPGTPGAVRFTVTVPAESLSRATDAQAFDRVSIAGYGATGGAPGTPELPTRLLMVAVPALGDVHLTAAASDLSVRDGVSLGAYPGRLADGRAVSEARPSAASLLAGASGPEGARLLDVTWMRNQRVARVLVSPAAYDPAARRLTVATRVDVELAVTTTGVAGPEAEPDDPFERIYQRSFVNYEQGRAWRRPSADVVLAAVKRGALPRSALAAVTLPPDTSVYVGRTWIKIAIQKTGFYAVNFSRLRGLSLFGTDTNTKTPLDSLRLFTWPGRTLLPVDTYCDSCDYREVAIGIVRDVSAPPDPAHPNIPGPPDSSFADNDDAFYFFAQGPDGWESDYDASRPDTNFTTHPYDRNNYYYLTVATAEKPVSGLRYPHPPLRIGVAPGSVRDVTPRGDETPQRTVAGRLHLEQDNEYWPDASAVGSTLVWERWFWRSLTAGGGTFTQTLDVPDADTTQLARFRMRYWGLSDNIFNVEGTPCSTDVPDHFLDCSFDDITFPRRGWFGTNAQDQSGQTFDSSGVVLRRTGNVLSLTVPTVPFIPSCPSRLDRSGLAFYELYYARKLIPVQDAIEFRTQPHPVRTSDKPPHGQDPDLVAGAPLTDPPRALRYRYDIGPFVNSPAARAFVFDITEPLRPVRVQSDSVLGSAGAYTLAIADTQSVSHRYIVVPDSILLTGTALIPAAQLADAPFTSRDNLRSHTNHADDVIVYYDGFKAAADSLAAWRALHLPVLGTTQRDTAIAVPISAVYDQFSGGRTDAGAIRNFLRAAVGWSRRPTYVTFLGDASFDFKDITGRALPGQPGCLLPSFEFNYDGSFQIRRQYATDDWLVNVDDPVAVLPDYLTGRIPADDPATALAVVTQKVLGYERAAPFGEYRNTALFMADDAAQGQKDDPIHWGHVDETNQLNVDHTPFQIDRQYVYLHTFPDGPGATKPGARAALTKDLDAGTTLFNFVGHGSPFKMTDEAVFLDSDAGTLTNGLKMSLLVSASCDVGKFNDPSVQSLGERMFMQPNGGCIGVVSSTEQSIGIYNAALNDALYDALFNRDTLSVNGIRLPGTGQYHVPISAALLSAKSVAFTPSVNNQKFQLMGDPATLLNLPQLWTDVHFTDAAGRPLAEVARGATVNFSGRVLDQPGGTPVPLSGVASVLIEDSAPTFVTPQAFDKSVTSYRFSAGAMFHGDVTLNAGTFAGKFVVPLDATAGSLGRIRAYVSGSTNGGPVSLDGAGNLQMAVVPGTADPNDTQGPRITLSFLGGSTNVHPDATLQINLFDDSGIMTTAHAPQNSIIVTVDDHTGSRTDVTSTYRYAADSYQSGTAAFQLPNLAPGPHEVKVSAADNLATGLTASQHRSSAIIDFQVIDTPPLKVVRSYLFPDPIRSGGRGSGGVIVVDAPGDSINTLVRLYTVAGKLVRTLRQMGGIGQVQVVWDGLDDEGDRLAQGTYLYKVYVSVRDADGKSDPSRKATAEGRFVVLSP